MTNLNSCIATFTSYTEAMIAKQILQKGYPNKKQIILLKSRSEKNRISDISNDDFFYQIAVPKDTMDNYLNLLQRGSFLLIASGSYKEVELAYQLLIENGYMSSIHLHHSKIKG